MAVGAHRDQVTSLALDPLDDFIGRITVSQLSLRGNTGGCEFLSHLFQIGGVGRDLRAYGFRTISSGGPAIGHVQ